MAEPDEVLCGQSTATFSCATTAIAGTPAKSSKVRFLIVQCGSNLAAAWSPIADHASRRKLAPGRDQVVLKPDMGAVYGNMKQATGQIFEIDLEAGTTYYFWTVIGTSDGHISIWQTAFGPLLYVSTSRGHCMR